MSVSVTESHTLSLCMYIELNFNVKAPKNPSRPRLLCPHYSSSTTTTLSRISPKTTKSAAPLCFPAQFYLLIYIQKKTVTQFVFVTRNYTKQYIRMVYCDSLDTYFNIYFITCPRIGYFFFYLFVGTHAVFIGCYIHSVEYRAENIFAVHKFGVRSRNI